MPRLFRASLYVAGVAVIGCAGSPTPPFEIVQNEDLPATACAGMGGQFRNEGKQTVTSGREPPALGKTYLDQFASNQAMPKTYQYHAQERKVVHLSATVQVTIDGAGGLILQFLDANGNELARDRSRGNPWKCQKAGLVRTYVTRGGGEGASTDLTIRESIGFTDAALVVRHHWHFAPTLLTSGRDSYFEDRFERVVK